MTTLGLFAIGETILGLFVTQELVCCFFARIFDL